MATAGQFIKSILVCSSSPGITTVSPPLPTKRFLTPTAAVGADRIAEDASGSLQLVSKYFHICFFHF